LSQFNYSTNDLNQTSSWYQWQTTTRPSSFLNSNNLELYATVNVAQPIYTMTVSDNGVLAIGHEEKIATRIAANLELLTSVNLPNFYSITSLAFLNDVTLAVGSNTGKLVILDVSVGAIVDINENAHQKKVAALIATDNGYLISASWDRKIKLWSIANGTLKYANTLIGHISDVNALALLPNNQLASGDDEGTIWLWDMQNGTATRVIYAHTGWVLALAPLSDEHLASGSMDRTIKIWHSYSGSLIRTLDAYHTGSVYALIVLSNGNIASADDEGNLFVWDKYSWSLVKKFSNYTQSINCLVDLGRNLLASSSPNGYIRLWKY
jgi:WD40 repeat protein